MQVNLSLLLTGHSKTQLTFSISSLIMNFMFSQTIVPRGVTIPDERDVTGHVALQGGAGVGRHPDDERRAVPRALGRRPLQGFPRPGQKKTSIQSKQQQGRASASRPLDTPALCTQRPAQSPAPTQVIVWIGNGARGRVPW